MADPNFLSPVTNPFGLTDVGSTSKPTLADIDGDGDLDAFVGNSDGNTIFFENTGDASNPSFATAVTNPFGLADVGRTSSPTLADIDGDGDLDAFVGELFGNTIFFENTGDASNPSFATAVTNPFGLTNVGSSSNPTFADIDGDGDLDAFVGEYYASAFFFENTGDASNPSFATAVVNPFGITSVGDRTDPNFVDFDGDGDLDALIAEEGTRINFFENTGDASNPSFATVQINPFGLIPPESFGAASFADLDGDGDLDALLGGLTGNNFFFENAPVVTNQPPIAVDDTVTTDEDSATSGNVLTNDTDADSDPLTVTEVNGVSADVGTEITLNSGALLTVNSNGTFDYDPNGQFEALNTGDVATDSFTYTITDGTETDTATVTVTINGVDEPLNLVGTNKKDTLTGGGGNDTISGGNGADELNGGGGDDIIGGDGNDNGPDIINGGTGNDTLTGGNGPDVFIFAEGDGTDTITDFQTPDEIGLAGGLSFSDLSFSGSDIIVTSTSEVLATLTGVDATTLTASDFTTV